MGGKVVKYREGRWLPENVPKQLYGCQRTSVCSSIASQPWDESLKLSQRSWVPVARSPMEETKACPRALSRSHDQLRKQRWLYHLSGPAFSSSRVTRTLLMTPPWILQSLKRKIRKMKGRMLGGVSLVWRFPLMPVGPMCLHRSLGVWNSYQMPLTHALYWIFVLFLFYYFNRHGCFYYLSRESWYQGRQTDFEEFQEVSELLMFCFAFNFFFFLIRFTGQAVLCHPDSVCPVAYFTARERKYHKGKMSLSCLHQIGILYKSRPG